MSISSKEMKVVNNYLREHNIIPNTKKWAGWDYGFVQTSLSHLKPAQQELIAKQISNHDILAILVKHSNPDILRGLAQNTFLSDAQFEKILLKPNLEYFLIDNPRLPAILANQMAFNSHYNNLFNLDRLCKHQFHKLSLNAKKHIYKNAKSALEFHQNPLHGSCFSSHYAKDLVRITEPFAKAIEDAPPFQSYADIQSVIFQDALE